MLKVDVPGGENEVLLHSCCAPCSGAVLECLLANGVRPVVFFSNSNITPFSEYELRRSELARYCKSLGVTMVDDVYDHDAWLEFVLDGDPAALASAPERGPRCRRCFEYRLRRAALYAYDHGLRVLTTTLASSRWKDLDQVTEAGLRVCRDSSSLRSVPEEHAVLFWPQNWRKGGLQPRRAEIIREQQFYNQTWCGCEFSHER